MTCPKRGKGTKRMVMMNTVMNMMMVMVFIHHAAADLSTLMQKAAQSSQDRPERSALEPPTVTALSPPNRSKGSNRSTGSILTHGEQIGSHIPPVVASQSPSSNSGSKDYRTRYMHMNKHVYPPIAPIATAASSGYRPGITTGRRSLSDTHRTIAAPMPHLVNGTTLSIQQDYTSWAPPISYAPPRPSRNGYESPYRSSSYPPVPRGYPQHHPRIYEDTVVPEPSFVNGKMGESSPHDRGLGVWSKTEERSSSGGLWENTPRHPSYSQGHHRMFGHRIIEEEPVRTDTFGHSISEDLSHLGNQYPLHGGNSRWGQVHHPSQNPDDYNPLRKKDQIQDNIHTASQSNLSTQAGEAHDQDTSSPVSNGSDKSFTVNRFGMHPITYGSNFNDGDTRVPDSPSMETDTQHELQGNRHHSNRKHQQTGTLSIPYSNPVFYASEDSIVREELSQPSKKEDSQTTARPLQEFDQHLSHGEDHNVEDSSVPEEQDTDVSRHSLGRSKGGKKNRKGKNKKRGRKNKENRRGRKNRKETSEIVYTSVISSTGTTTSPIAHEPHTITTTTATMTSSVLSKTSMPFNTLPSALTTKESPFSSTPPILAEPPRNIATPERHPVQSELPALNASLQNTFTESPELTLQEHNVKIKTTEPFVIPFNHTSVLEPPDLSPWHQSITSTSPTWIPLTKNTTVKPTLSTAPTMDKTFTTPEKANLPLKPTTVFTPKTTPTSVLTVPRAGSLTLPPSTKPSEASIISFSVMTVPSHERHEETQLEDTTATRKRQNQKASHKNRRKYHHHMINDYQPRRHTSARPRIIDDNMVVRTKFVREKSKDNYAFPVKGFMIITGIMGALAVFTIVVLISYAIIKCSKQPIVNNYQVSDHKPATE